MKVKNIMFSGFAAAILMGTVGADAAIPFQIASKAYVDGQTKININNVETDVADIVEGLISGDDSVDSKIEDAIGDLGDDANGDAYTDVADALADKADKSEIGDLGNDANGDPYADVADALADKVNVSDKATSIRTVQGGASNDKWATELAVATIVEGITGGSGTVDQQIAAKLGSDFTGDNAYATVTAALADKQDALSFDSAPTQGSTNPVTSGGVYTALGGKADASALTTLNEQINGDGTPGDSGLAGDVAALQDAIGDGTTGIAKDVDDLQETVGDGQLANGFSNGVDNLTEAVNDLMANKADADNVYTKSQLDTMIGAKLDHPATNTCTAGSGHCVLSLDTSGNLTWVDVTQPFAVTD